MSAYALVEVTVTNPEAMSEYRDKVPGTVEAHGGKYLVLSETAKVLEGGLGEHPVKVVLEFPSMQAAQGWYDSPEYQAIIPNRMANSSGNFLLVDGV
jgi:uncharacterized protein (DUF1330 family)